MLHDMHSGAAGNSKSIIREAEGVMGEYERVTSFKENPLAQSIGRKPRLFSQNIGEANRPVSHRKELHDTDDYNRPAGSKEEGKTRNKAPPRGDTSDAAGARSGWSKDKARGRKDGSSKEVSGGVSDVVFGGKSSRGGVSGYGGGYGGGDDGAAGARSRYY